VTSAAIAFQDVTLGYERHPAVHHLDGFVAPGSLLAIVGPNGGGKSTLLKGIAGAIRPMEGWIDIAGARRHDIAYLPQQAEIDPSFPLCVFEMVAMGLWRRIGAFATAGRKEQERVSAAITTVGLEGLERRYVGTLSGGQLQRVLFARLLVQDASIILLDEPFAAVDARTCGDLMTLIKTWRGEGRTVLSVMHDFPMVRAHFPETLLLAREKIAWGDTAQVLTDANLAQAQTMSEAWVDHADLCRRDVA
jgi:zinc/manganese transport system ATP-binding protein